MTAPSPLPSTEEVRRWRRALLPMMLVAPVVVALLGCVAFLLAAPELPERVIVHWGPDGTQTGSPYLALLCLPLTGAVAAVLWVAVRGPANVRLTPVLRAVLGLPLWLACFLTIGLVGSVVLQVRPDAPVPGVPLLLGLVVGLVAGGVAALTAPVPPVQPAAPAPPRLPAVQSGERLVWLGRAGTTPGLMAAVLGVLGAVVVVVVVGGLATDPWLAVVSAVPVLALPLAASMLHWRVRIDGAGVRAVGALGFPTLRVPLGDVAAADVVIVAPIGDYGGLGLRHSRGVTAIATRGGEALQVTRTDGRRLVLTVDDAATAAGVLRALHP